MEKRGHMVTVAIFFSLLGRKKADLVPLCSAGRPRVGLDCRFVNMNNASIKNIRKALMDEPKAQHGVFHGLHKLPLETHKKDWKAGISLSLSSLLPCRLESSLLGWTKILLILNLHNIVWTFQWEKIGLNVNIQFLPLLAESNSGFFCSMLQKHRLINCCNELTYI